MAKQYLDYEGLKLYTQEMKKWVLAQLQGIVSEQDAKYDDTKVYTSFAEFPRTGTEDVIYIDQETGAQYVWNPSLNNNNGGYEILTEAISSGDISNLLDS